MLKFLMFLSISLGVPFHEVRQWSSAEITLYMCYYRINPWGEERSDIRNAMSMQMTANMHRDTKKKAQPYELSDFMPFAERAAAEDEDGVDAMREMFKGIK